MHADQLAAALSVLLVADTSEMDCATPEYMRIQVAKEFARKAMTHGRFLALRNAETDPKMIKAYDDMLSDLKTDIEALGNRLLQIISSQSLPLSPTQQ